MCHSAQSEPKVERYRRLRATGKQVIGKLYAAAKDPRFDIIKAAKKLTMHVVDRTVVFDGENDTAALADFFFHEMRFGGKRILDVLAESNTDLTTDERDVLAAHCASRCSLLEFVSAAPATCDVRLRDLLEPGPEPIMLTDISMSHGTALKPGDLLFTRLVHCQGITLGAGLFFGFRAVHRLHLINAFHARMSTVAEKERSQRMYVFFYRKHRELGVAQAYVDVV
jgi:hypothetical protein